MIYDITQEVFSCKVFPGDLAPSKTSPRLIQNGDPCNLTDFSMCAHNGTHVDAPFHFIDGAKTIDKIPLDAFVGACYVAEHQGDVSAENAQAIVAKARAAEAGERILIKGMATITAPAAKVFADAKIRLIGNESQTVGPENAPREVHLIFLGSEVVILEGVVLREVPEGRYFLSAAPLNLGGCDGAPCRAYLIGEE